MAELSEFSCLNWNYEFKPVGTQDSGARQMLQKSGALGSTVASLLRAQGIRVQQRRAQGPALSPADLYQLLNFSETQFLSV